MSQFRRPEINDIRPVEICTRTIEDEKHEQLVRKKKYQALGVLPPDEDDPSNKDKDKNQGGTMTEMALMQRLAELEDKQSSERDPELQQQQLAEQLARQMEQSVETVLRTHQQQQHTTQIADDLFSRGRDSQFREHQDALTQQQQLRNRAHLDGLLDIKTGLTPETKEELERRHPPLPPSKFLELAKQQQQEFRRLSEAGVIATPEQPEQQTNLTISTSVSPSTPTPRPTPTPTENAGNIAVEIRDISYGETNNDSSIETSNDSSNE